MEEIANHSDMEATEVIESNETPIESTDSPPQEEAPRGINVKYNKEERFVPEDEVPTWVQKGLNYDKVSEKAQQAERYQQNLNRIAEFYGFPDHESYMEALEREAADRAIEEKARRFGVDEDFLRNEFNPIIDELNTTKSQLQKLQEAEHIRTVEAQLASLASKYSDFGKYQNKVIQMSIERGYDLEDAYIIASNPDRIEATRQEVQRETLKNIQRNADSATGYLGEDAPDQASGYAAMSAAERKAFRDKVKRGEL